MPKVWNIHGCNIPKGAIYVGRPTMYGNPFTHLGFGNGIVRVETREESVRLYRGWVEGRVTPVQYPLLPAPPTKRAIQALRGKDLICWCAPLACHADVLLEVANQNEEL